VAGPDDPPDDPPADGGAEAPGEPTAPAGDEPRGKDIARSKTTADLDERLDAQTVAQLAAWFGLPSVTQLQEEEEARARAAAAAAEDDPRRERNELDARIAADVQPAMIARLERWTPAGDALLTDLGPPIEPVVDPDLVHLDAAFIERLGVIAEAREVQRPPWIDAALAESAPQAILRDLHRPESEFRRSYEYAPPEPTLSERTAEIRTIACADYQVRPEASGWASAVDAFAELRHWKQANWGELPIERAPKEPEESDPDEEGSGSPPRST
jgi:hypothetical protein